VGTTLAELFVLIKANSDDLQKGLSDAEKKTQSAAGNMAKFLGGAIVGGATLAAGAIIGIGTAAFDVASDIDSATDQIGASLGITGDEAKKFGDVIKAVYGNNFGDSIEDVGKGVEAVTKTLKLAATDPALPKMTENAFRLRDVFGVEITESVDAVKTLMENFGVTSEEAFDLLARGYQTGLDRSGDFLDTIGEYSVQFAEGGASAVEFFSALDSGLQGGMLGTDKAADAFKEFRVRIQDGSTLTADSLEMIGLSAEDITSKLASGSITVKDAWDLVQRGLIETTDSAMQFQAGVGLIGTQFEDLGAKVVLGIDITEDWAEGGIQSITEMDSKYTSLGGVIEGMWRKFQVGIAPAGEAMLGFVNDNLPAIQGVVNTVSGAVVTFIGQIPLAMESVRAAWDEDWAGMRTTVNTFTAEVPGQFQIFWAEFKSIFDVGGNDLAVNWDLLWGFTLPGFVTGLVNVVLAQLTEFTRAINGIFTALYSLVTLDWAGFWGGLGDTMNAATNGMLNTLEFFFGPELRNKLVGSLTVAWDDMKKLWEQISEWWNNTLGSLIGIEAPAIRTSSPSDFGIVNPLNQSMEEINSINRLAPGGFSGFPSQPAGGSYNINVGGVTVGNGGDPYDAGREVGRGVTDELRKRGG
jgi:hypothetical protein